jgi:hypothetical protein
MSVVMAVKQLITCDLDADGNVDARSVLFSLEGKEFQIDLCDEHLSAFRATFGIYLEVARATGSRRVASSVATPSSSAKADRRPDLAEIRVWAAENGYHVAERGRIQQAVIDAFDERDGAVKKSRKRS